ncbi:DNA repair protein RecO [Candidatus Uhrbacteria bacterium RIFCSPHIGHO2_12_FULL_60_25]|uniref:DNA repair protein RecO n=1 Tax=Candidatus Uhrbacteria bacterium RIFCSPHIGHO2_12_FULL_60_25 TaxID=1802399 RepID=A0A1F7ULS1_9BACT|nr:MAG: DNA repair protein RecO [Candidatus Uhrbacteria bacterium RIFCSPHIGHO2_12_FULL_60_25]
MPYLRDRAIVLRNEPFKEHDRKVVLFGIEHGLLEAVARGASRKEAKQAGHIVPMSEIEVLIAKGAVYDKLAVARLVEQHRAIRDRLGALAFVGSFFDLFERLQRPGIVDPGLYELLLDVLSIGESLPDEPSAERARLLWSAAALKLLDRIGLAPALSHCVSCRENVGESDAWMLPFDGTVACADCYRGLRTAHPNATCLAPTALTLLRFLRREPFGRVLLLTASTDVFAAASHAVSVTLQQAPLSKEPHGSETIFALLS